MNGLNINIISTEKDMDLFSNDNYYNKIKEILNNIRNEYELTSKHFIACHENFIELYDTNKSLMLIREL